MKLPVKIFISLFFLLGVIPQATADIVRLKSGYRMEGIITRETDEYVELEINFGKVKFYNEQIDRVERSSEKQNKMMEDSWKEERLRKEAESKSSPQEKGAGSREIAAGRKGDHLFVNAVLNGRVNARLLIDTGASYVVVSSAIAKALNINLNGAKGAAAGPEVKMSLADGREVSGKVFKLDTVSVGSMKADSVDAAVIYQENAFQGFDGLLGMSFLKLFKFQVNLEESKLILN